MNNPILVSIGLLTLSNVFMTFAWYAHLKALSHKPWIVAALHQLGHRAVRIPAAGAGQPHWLQRCCRWASSRFMQEAITLTVFVPFALFYLKEPLKLDYLWSALCIMGAVFFAFRSRFMTGV
jgi:uncharacterized protein (DUF486 family)